MPVYPSYWNHTAYTPPVYTGYGTPQQIAYPSYAQQPVNTPNDPGLIWVEGEVGAKAFQMPPGWPMNKPVTLWDSTDTNIFIKSWGNMGIPNPIQKLHYTIEETPSPVLLQNGSSQEKKEPEGKAQAHNYITRDELEKDLDEIKQMISNLMRPRNNPAAQPAANRGDRS